MQQGFKDDTLRLMIRVNSPPPPPPIPSQKKPFLTAWFTLPIIVFLPLKQEKRQTVKASHTCITRCVNLSVKGRTKLQIHLIFPTVQARGKTKRIVFDQIIFKTDNFSQFKFVDSYFYNTVIFSPYCLVDNI